MEHWNVQVNIQKVVTTPARSDRGFAGPVTTEAKRDVTEVLKLAVVADTEQEAYDKVAKLLSVYSPSGVDNPDRNE